MAETGTVLKNRVIELSFMTTKGYTDPFRDVELDVLFQKPEGGVIRVPAFWRGGGVWSVRFSSDTIGLHAYETVCSDRQNGELHGRKGTVTVEEGHDDSVLYRHGRLTVSEDGRYFQHRDGTPFFWLGDTWWMWLAERVRWPEDFHRLTEDRVKKGFTVVQIVAGLYPDMAPFDRRGVNEAGFPWDEEFHSINPAYFDMADRRIEKLVESGLMPCIVGCWGYYLSFAGEDVLKKHWRYLIARYGAYPVTWCACGEADMSFYGSVDWDEETNRPFQEIRLNPDKMKEYQKWAGDAWRGIMEYIKETDGYHNLLTAHPGPAMLGRVSVGDPAVMDFDMLQTGHGGYDSLTTTADCVRRSAGLLPVKPVINGEVNYEGIGGMCSADVQRLSFWLTMMNGACGYTYGANGIWQVNEEGKPYGMSPHGLVWGYTPWTKAMDYLGSAQLGFSKALLEKYDWWQLRPHPEWVENTPNAPAGKQVHASGVPGRLRLFYLPSSFAWTRPVLKELESGYEATFIDLITGTEFPAGIVTPDADGNWRACYKNYHFLPVYSDMVLVLEKQA